MPTFLKSEVFHWTAHSRAKMAFYRLSESRVNKGNGFSPRTDKGEARLPFDLFVEAYKGDEKWIEGTLKNAREVYDADEAPAHSPQCVYCQYRGSANNFA